MRAMCHGFAAAVGKAGALVAGVVFNLVDDRGKCECWGASGCVFEWVGRECGCIWPGVANTALESADATGLAVPSPPPTFPTCCPTAPTHPYRSSPHLPALPISPAVWISAACGIAGVFCTLIFCPDLTGLDLKEGDKR